MIEHKKLPTSLEEAKAENLKIWDLGNYPFEAVWQLQKALVAQKKTHHASFQGEVFDHLILCSHPPCITFGKQTASLERFHDFLPFYNIERGGKATYHGPSQLILYPILDLKKKNFNLGGFLDFFQQLLCRGLKEIFGITVYDLKGEHMGLWHDKGQRQYKVASLGMAFQRGICFHGMAINIYSDPLAHQGINPCGFSPHIMTCVEEILDSFPPKEALEQLKNFIIDHWNF